MKSSNPCALIIDDEADIRELIAISLDRIGLDTHAAGNLSEARNLLNTYHFSVCLTDMKLPDGNGVDFVKHVLKIQPDLPVAVITAHGNMDAAVEAMKNGAFDFVSKPVDITLLRRLVLQAIGMKDQTTGTAANDKQLIVPSVPDARMSFPTKESIQPLPRTGQPDVAHHSVASNTPPLLLNGEERLIGQSESMRALKALIAKVARSNAPVWITGESGTGKELIARLIHENSSRANEPFVAINCGAIPSQLMESEMFGHKRGSFTGAHTDHEGLFAQAENGTLFLDEVAELPLQMQVKLLRAIQERSIRPVGSSREISTNVRILSASHIDLNDEIEKGTFRHDLYYRLNVICIKAPSLRQRLSDIPEISQSILSAISSEEQRYPPYTLSESAKAHLSKFHFPGNVRELENILHRAVALCESQVIEPDDLDVGPSEPPTPVQQDLSGELPSKSQVERERIREALIATRWNRKNAAKMLGYTYRQLRYRIEQHGLDNDAAP
ncbi:MAG: sigma-54-dependent transcriptional regulator [Granulosicoccus sp.]